MSAPTVAPIRPRAIPADGLPKIGRDERARDSKQRRQDEARRLVRPGMNELGKPATKPITMVQRTPITVVQRMLMVVQLLSSAFLQTSAAEIVAPAEADDSAFAEEVMELK